MIAVRVTSQRGIGLIELLMAIIIVSLMAASAVALLSSQKRIANIKITAQQAQSVMRALNLYYYGHCRDTAFQQPTVTLLLDEGYLQKQAVNRIGDTFTVSIDAMTIPAKLIVTADITIGGDIETYRGMMGATSSTGATVSWVKNATKLSSGLSSSLVSFTGMYETPCH